MFTGIISELGDVVSLKLKPAGATLTITARELSKKAEIGDSIAINGVCLTIVRQNRDSLSFDLSGETLNSTNLGKLKSGDRINLEPSLRADGKLGGHFVTGHVDAVGKIRSKDFIGDAFRLAIEATPEIIGPLVEKGSIAVDGISLTVVDVLRDSFTVVIIPHTASVTTLGFKNTDDTVNLEGDIIGKYVARLLARDTTKASDEGLIKTLREAGYM